MMNKTFPQNDEHEVSDSTDWLETPLPSLAPVDSALRCQVCKDFYTTPMVTSCSHTFCSLCIRRCLNNDGRCPACRAQDQEMKLRCNWALEELVEAFKKARPEVMEFAKRPLEDVSSLSPKRKWDVVEVEGESGSPVRKRTRSSGRTQRLEHLAVLDSEGYDEDHIPGDDGKDGLILCPICQDGFPTVAAVQLHVDSCDGEQKGKKRAVTSTRKSIQPPTTSIPAKKPERLPQLHYSMVKDNALRKKLADLGISASGPRQLMERRYTEWVTLWNANCDSKNPKVKRELQRELDVWERTHGGRASSTSSAQSSGANVTDKDFDGEAWSSKHDDSFRELIAIARRKRVVGQETPDSALNPIDSAAGPTDIPPNMALEQARADIKMTDSRFISTAAHVPGERQEEVQPASPIQNTGLSRRFFVESEIPQSPPKHPTQPPPVTVSEHPEIG